MQHKLAFLLLTSVENGKWMTENLPKESKQNIIVGVSRS